MASTTRLQVVELLRGLAALSVAWFHLTSSHSGSWVARSGSYGWLGVEIFFVISGFIVPYSMTLLFDRYRVSDAPAFLIRRMIRLEPAYFISIILVIILYYLSRMTPGFAGGEQKYSVLQILAHFFYLITFTDYQWIQPVYWTLGYEFIFYIFMSISLSILLGKGQRLITFGIAGFLAAAVTLSWLAPPVMLFVMGFAVFRRRHGLSAATEASALIALAVITLSSHGQHLEAICGGATALALLFGADLVLPSRFIPLISGLGAISYSLYLVHIPVGGRVVNLGRRIVDGSFQEFLLSLLALAVSLAAAWTLWRFVELPSIAASRRWTQRIS